MIRHTARSVRKQYTARRQAVANGFGEVSQKLRKQFNGAEVD